MEAVLNSEVLCEWQGRYSLSGKMGREGLFFQPYYQPAVPPASCLVLVPSRGVPVLELLAIPELTESSLHNVPLVSIPEEPGHLTSDVLIG